MLELYYNFFKKFRDTEKYEKLERDTDSLFLFLSEENLEDNILPEKKTNGKRYVCEIVQIASLRMQRATSSPEHVVLPTRSMIGKRETGLFKEEFRCSELFCLCSKTYYCYNRKSNKYKFTSKRLVKTPLEDCGDGAISKYRKVLEEAVNVTSINRGFRTRKDSVATYEQTKKVFSYFYPKRLVEEDGIHTKPLDL